LKSFVIFVGRILTRFFFEAVNIGQRKKKNTILKFRSKRFLKKKRKEKEKEKSDILKCVWLEFPM
jgi:hypothetical protein